MNGTKSPAQQEGWTRLEIAGAVVSVVVLAGAAVAIMVAVGRIGTVAEVIGALLATVVGVALYILPTVIASRRNMPHTGSIAVVNLLLGFTYVGWVIALAMAVAGKRD